MRKKIAIVGVGFVGGAVYEMLKNNFDIKRYDPFKDFSCSKQDVNNCEVVFLCVPTPFDWKKKDCDYSVISKSLKWIKNDKVIVIKSTLPPGSCRQLAKKYSHKIVFNPEFLREKTAIVDVKNETKIILAGDKIVCRKVQAIYKAVYPAKVRYIFTSFENAELAKIATNTFLAAKVSFCNELNEFCHKSGISYGDFRKVWLTDSRIGESHTAIQDGGGFSGSCFPKDLNALITKMQKAKVKPVMHEAIWESNRKYRKIFRDPKFKR